MNFVSMAAAGAVAVFGVMAAGAALAADLELRWIKADGTVVGERSLSTADIEALPQTTFTTNTPWTTAPTEFTGPELSE
ncbi:MAG: hypothetical protein J0H08_13400, partial [Rhizobiales bacterium]|nr:hypothetical protein [Hyphomicrobiales bacterium]